VSDERIVYCHGLLSLKTLCILTRLKVKMDVQFWSGQHEVSFDDKAYTALTVSPELPK